MTVVLFFMVRARISKLKLLGVRGGGHQTLLCKVLVLQMPSSKLDKLGCKTSLFVTKSLFVLQVNGAVVSVRTKCDKIGMWLGDSTAAESIQTVGRRVKERLGIDAHVSLGFEAHEDTMKKSGSTAKNRYVV